jgi:hypothetical protein
MVLMTRQARYYPVVSSDPGHSTNVYHAMRKGRTKTPAWFIVGASIMENEMWRYLFAEANIIAQHYQPPIKYWD